MPQLDFATWPGQIFWALVIFAILYGVMHRVFLPRLRGNLETRSGRIEGALAEARRLRDEAEAQAEVARAETAEAQFKAAQAILLAVDADPPPRHLLLGADALRYTARHAGALQAEIGDWAALSTSVGVSP